MIKIMKNKNIKKEIEQLDLIIKDKVKMVLNHHITDMIMVDFKGQKEIQKIIDKQVLIKEIIEIEMVGRIILIDIIINIKKIKDKIVIKQLNHIFKDKKESLIINIENKKKNIMMINISIIIKVISIKIRILK
jgi:hypothetical protein